jgi:hypothetical protein
MSPRIGGSRLQVRNGSLPAGENVASIQNTPNYESELQVNALSARLLEHH